MPLCRLVEFLDVLEEPEERGSRSLQNNCKYLLDYMASHPRGVVSIVSAVRISNLTNKYNMKITGYWDMTPFHW